MERLRGSMGDFSKSALAARALVTAAYANRLLGENMGEAVIDGSAVQPRVRNLERAQAHFTEALSVATVAGNATLANAARAGRASVRLWLSDNAGAVADAAAVPLGFVYQAQFNPGTPNTWNNWVWYISSNTPYRAHSVVGTFFESYYPETGDPRTSWGRDPKVPTAEFTTVPWLFQTKYTGETSPMNLSSGREMVLIRAEVALREGSWQQAVQLINSLRQGLVSAPERVPLPLWTARDATEAWTALKRERAIELWLETRRLGDLWRWVDAKTPGEMEDMSNRVRLCFPVAPSEMRTNPNIPLTHKSPTNPLFRGAESRRLRDAARPAGALIRIGPGARMGPGTCRGPSSRQGAERLVPVPLGRLLGMPPRRGGAGEPAPAASISNGRPPQAIRRRQRWSGPR